MPFLKVQDHLIKQDLTQTPLRGIVVKNDDPRQLNRVKCTIEGLWEETDLDKLPWIMPWMEAGLGGSADSSGTQVPELQSELLIEFPFKSHYAPYYTGRWQNDLSSQGNFFEDYPASYGTRDTQNTYFKVNKAKQFAEFRHTSNTRIRVNREAEAEIRTRGKVVLTSEDGQTVMTMDMDAGTFNLNTKTSSQIDGPSHTVNSEIYKQMVGTKESEIEGSHTENIIGGMKQNVGGSRSTTVVSNSADAVSGDRSETTAGETTKTYGQGVEETVVLGDHKRELLAGDFITSILLGNILMETKAGNLELSNPLARLAIALSGNIDLENATASLNLSNAGQVDIKSLLNTAIEATLNFQVKANAMASIEASALAEIKAPITKLNSGTAPVLTVLTDPLVDLITGAPHIGVPTVLAGS